MRAARRLNCQAQMHMNPRQSIRTLLCYNMYVYVYIYIYIYIYVYIDYKTYIRI